ncbi:hypothetical protein [Paenibacillus sp. NAIST15-1]|nr:hypothetical protein [Paenibacillus sp. NAIST15-1]
MTPLYIHQSAENHRLCKFLIEKNNIVEKEPGSSNPFAQLAYRVHL